METELKFKTKTGFCHILTDKILLTKNGITENLNELKTENKINRLLILYGIFAIPVFYLAFKKLQANDFFGTILYGGIGAFWIYQIIKSRNHSTTQIIERNKIHNVEFKPAERFLTRSYFKVDFEQNDGKIKRRLIMLPGSLNNGTKETEKALEIMKSTGLIKNNVG